LIAEIHELIERRIDAVPQPGGVGCSRFAPPEVVNACRNSWSKTRPTLGLTRAIQIPTTAVNGSAS
jgi:hypothetical protein